MEIGTYVSSSHVFLKCFIFPSGHLISKANGSKESTSRIQRCDTDVYLPSPRPPLEVFWVETKASGSSPRCVVEQPTLVPFTFFSGWIGRKRPLGSAVSGGVAEEMLLHLELNNGHIPAWGRGCKNLFSCCLRVHSEHLKSAVAVWAGFSLTILIIILATFPFP